MPNGRGYVRIGDRFMAPDTWSFPGAFTVTALGGDGWATTDGEYDGSELIAHVDDIMAHCRRLPSLDRKNGEKVDRG